MRVLLVILIGLISLNSLAQSSKEIIKVIDDLTMNWDQQVQKLQTYSGMREYCRSREMRSNTISLVNDIHHYHLLLYLSVKEKYEENKDMEAFAALKDIERLEVEYTTTGFLDFLHKECTTVNNIEKKLKSAKNKSVEKDIIKMEKELVRYVSQVTAQIDLIDEHAHHIPDL
ncbi:hypothetical protein [Reichenbachiella versicolor]|uniref:hypothetical protein n=1 Tax=Reichenbachiella versicolor TaxID=1821036 RepID=UPI000D6E08DD|nr:hypothetical protein [Reichenbachiella versicolor]